MASEIDLRSNSIIYSHVCHEIPLHFCTAFNGTLADLYGIIADFFTEFRRNFFTEFQRTFFTEFQWNFCLLSTFFRGNGTEKIDGIPRKYGNGNSMETLDPIFQGKIGFWFIASLIQILMNKAHNS